MSIIDVPRKSRLQKLYCRLLNTLDPQTKNIIWIASYPKSGNTWVRSILAALYDRGENFLDFAPDIYFDGLEYSIAKAREIELNGTKVCFVKTHGSTFPTLPHHLARKVINFGFIYIYRHPLDVFLSALNFFYETNIESVFFDGKLKSVDELRENGELDFYFERYLEDFSIGNDVPLRRMCGGTYFDHVKSWFKSAQEQCCSFSTILKYEALVSDPFLALKPLANSLGKNDLYLQNALETSSRKTKADGRFFWKKKSGYFADYLSEQQIHLFQSKYKDFLQMLDYSTDLPRI